MYIFIAFMFGCFFIGSFLVAFFHLRRGNKCPVVFLTNLQEQDCVVGDKKVSYFEFLVMMMPLIAGRCFNISVFVLTLGNILSLCDIFSSADFPCHLLVVGLVHLHPGQTFKVTFLCLSALSQPALITFTLINMLC